MPSQILIVDDDQAIRSALVRWANKQGWTSFDAGHAKDALEILASHKIDIALVDVRLPDIDGLTLTKHILQLDEDIPVILITAFADLETARKALNIGVYEYFTKPFDFKDLHAGIDRALCSGAVAAVRSDGSSGIWPSSSVWHSLRCPVFKARIAKSGRPFKQFPCGFGHALAL